ncbi:hypothetical protein CBS101457_006863 [Exobasidium rhododendri]|nr:hypothetical protein CBS101457_006863 [Exobasidium rhododendri]
MQVLHSLVLCLLSLASVLVGVVGYEGAPSPLGQEEFTGQRVFPGEWDKGDIYATAVPSRHPQDPYERISLQSPDDSLRATFMPHGATMLEFWKQDRHQVWRDIITGYDDASREGVDPIHPFFGPQVGRYANRIRNGTFTLDGRTFHTPLNEKNISTIHGGHGFDNRSYEVTAVNASSVLFTLYDKAGNQGFPGAVVTTARYTLQDDGHFDIQMDAIVSEGRSPVMLSHHVYWALHGYHETQSILDHTLHMPKADKYIETDPILVPTGTISSVEGTPFDFQDPKTFATLFNDTKGVCGAGCQGWDNCFVMSEHERHDTILTLTSPESCIRMKVKTDQVAIQIYTCDGISGPGGSIPRKKSQGGDGTLEQIYENYSCMVIEMEDYIDGINHPEWGRDQIYDEDRPYHWRAEYSFDTV